MLSILVFYFGLSKVAYDVAFEYAFFGQVLGVGRVGGVFFGVGGFV
jgi:hypothetical protein